VWTHPCRHASLGNTILRRRRFERPESARRPMGRQPSVLWAAKSLPVPVQRKVFRMMKLNTDTVRTASPTSAPKVFSPALATTEVSPAMRATAKA